MANNLKSPNREPVRKRTIRQFMVQFLLAILIIIAVMFVFVYLHYQQDLKAAKDRLASGSLAQTECGLIEYVDLGQGIPVLSIHGAGGGFDQGSLIAPLLGDRFRIIAPSRFGYLNTPYPDDPSAVAQADAYACLLDYLGVDHVSVVGFSAGGPSALQFALRYPNRTDALVMVSAVSDASLIDPRPVDLSQNPVLSVLLTDFAFWTATTYFPERSLAFFGITLEAQQRLTPEEHDRAVRVLRMILPMSMRKTGNFNDQAHWFERGDFALERIKAPTLVIHAVDDTFISFAHGKYTAEHIPNARLESFDFGGHFVYLRNDVLTQMAAFLTR